MRRRAIAIRKTCDEMAATIKTSDERQTVWSGIETDVAAAAREAARHREHWIRLKIKNEFLNGHYESPIEAIFHAWWYAMRDQMMASDIELYPQKQVTIDGIRYRIDFQPKCSRYIPEPIIAIELDGHEFHEKTKEQVIYRNQRDRALQGAGWKVLHVSGSELIRNPQECLCGVLRIVSHDFIITNLHGR